jgi:flagella basal body P-ring formation protein FlgA
MRSEVTFPVNTDFLGPTSFTVSFRIAGNLEKRLYGTANIEVTQDIVTTARPLARHEIITAEDLRLTRVSLARLPRRVLMAPKDVIGKRTKRPLQAHAMIHAYEVETLPLLRKGDAVLILVESPLLKVSTMGEALEHGRRGETIRVRNVSSQRQVRAVVVDNKTVRVPF